MTHNNRRRQLLVTGAVLPLATAVSSKVANGKPQGIPSGEFFRYPALTNVRLAPGSGSLLGIRYVNGRRNIVVVDLSSRKARIITNFRDADVAEARWINPDRIVFSLVDLKRGSGDQVGVGRLFAINRDASEYREIAGERQPLQVAIYKARVREVGKLTDDIFVMVPSVQAQGRFASTLHRLNTKTSRASLVSLGAPPRVTDWVIDQANVARAAVATEEDVTRVHFRDSATSAWRVIAEFRNNEPERAVLPVAFDADGVMYVSAYRGQDNSAIFSFNSELNEVSAKPVFALKGFDLGEGLLQSDSGRVLGINYEAEREGTYWVDESARGVQAEIDRALPNRVNMLSGRVDAKGQTLLVNSYSDTEPSQYYLFDSTKMELKQVATSRPWIDGRQMGQTEFIRYTARDGLSVPAMLTLPRGSTRKNLPLVVMHYGGPWVRAIAWGFDENVQFLVSRGYAVLMPAPRGSTGFGLTHFTAGWRQWGLSMQDDVTDGVRWLIEQGIVDRKRICLAGASYGGYLTMMGLVKEPDLFRCGINWVGVTDPTFMFSVTWTDFNRVDAGRFTLPLLIGDPVKDAEQFRVTSPLRRAAEIKQPVLMAYGGLDERVPIINGERLRDALRPHNSNVEWIVYPDEGHGWLREENKIDFWQRVERFLEQHLQARG